MIPTDYITEWRRIAPWPSDEQVEQDLIISRALEPLLRPGTAWDLNTAMDAVLSEIVSKLPGDPWMGTI